VPSAPSGASSRYSTQQKQVIIHRAVTASIDPNVPLKDSGIRGWAKFQRIGRCVSYAI
jgi:hypothetical protein